MNDLSQLWLFLVLFEVLSSFAEKWCCNKWREYFECFMKRNKFFIYEQKKLLDLQKGFNF
jgi:hypothetical protein